VTESERTWLRRARQGDPEAFSRLVEAYQRDVFSLCYRMLGNAEDAEDAAQETFLRAFRAIRRYDPQRAFRSWLLTIASRYCIDRLRRRRLRWWPLEEVAEETLRDPLPEPEEMVLRHEQFEMVQSLLATLAPKDRAVVVLYYWHEYRLEEIAEALSLSVSAVKSRLFRARRALAQAVQRQQTEPLRGRHEPRTV